MKKRLLIFTHYNQNNLLADYIVYLIKKMNPLFKTIVFVSNSPLSEADSQKISGYCLKISTRQNHGYDFGAWKDAITDLGWDFITQYDSLTIMNDSCFGPLFDLYPIFSKMENTKLDFWGISGYRSRRENKAIKYSATPSHIHSYFISFNKPVLTNKSFQDFWKQVKYYNKLSEVIDKCEVRLTSLLSRSGFKYQTIINDNELQHTNVAHNHPLYMIQQRSPFVKIKSFLISSNPKSIKDSIANYSEYPIELIRSHFNQNFKPKDSILINNKTICANLNAHPPLPNGNIAVHFHFDNRDQLDSYLKLLSLYPNLDLFISVSDQELIPDIESIISINNYFGLKDIKYSVNTNHFAAWLMLYDSLLSYQTIGHFHSGNNYNNQLSDKPVFAQTKKMLDGINDCHTVFSNDPSVGIIIPDVRFDFSISVFPDELPELISLMIPYIWRQLGVQKSIANIPEIFSIQSFNGIFWCSNAAFKRIPFPETWKYLLSINTNVSTISAAFQFCLVYILWGAGFDFRIISNNSDIYNSVEMKLFTEKYEKMEQELHNFYHTFSWKIGTLLTIGPLKIRNAIRRIFSAHNG